MTLDLRNHPCFNDEARERTGRIHLPVAPACNIQCRYCNRRFDCINESRPGVSSTVLEPPQALAWLRDMTKAHPEITVVGIAGPGDPFANVEHTMETLRLVRRDYPTMLLCVATNGLAIEPHIDELARMAISHVTITMNAVDPEIGKKLYRWLRDGKRVLRGKAAAECLLDRQRAAIVRLKQHGIIVKVNSIIVPGINEEHIPEVALTAAELGADILNCIPLYPAPGSDFAEMPEPEPELVHRIRTQASRHLPLMRHCSRCRADAVGLLGQNASDTDMESLRNHGRSRGADRPYIAVASREGYLVNEHLGSAREFLVYSSTPEGPVCVARRTAPEPGDGDERWRQLGDLLCDCRALVVNFAGPRPVQVLKTKGIEVHRAAGLISASLEALFAGSPLPSYLTAEVPTRCGAGCGGNGGGCGA